MPYAMLMVVLLIVVYLPQIWVRWVMHRYSAELPDIPVTGSALARQLLARFGMSGFVVEKTCPHNDHFDPTDRAVRLSPGNYSGRSLTAIAVAAHEVGHAIQFHRREESFKLRQKYVPVARAWKQVGILTVLVAPLIGALVKAPVAILLVGGLGLTLQLIGASSHLFVLPTEWDASFKKAVPILTEEGYTQKKYVKAIQSVLGAAALTYFAAALADVLNITRWWSLLRQSSGAAARRAQVRRPSR